MSVRNESESNEELDSEASDLILSLNSENELSDSGPEEVEAKLLNTQLTTKKSFSEKKSMAKSDVFS